MVPGCNLDIMSYNLPDKYVITIGRQMGSGGRLLGRILADRLGIAFYDRELLMQAARDSGLSPEFFEQKDERRPQLFSGLFSINMGLSPITWFDNAAGSNDDALTGTRRSATSCTALPPTSRA